MKENVFNFIKSVDIVRDFCKKTDCDLCPAQASAGYCTLKDGYPRNYPDINKLYEKKVKNALNAISNACSNGNCENCILSSQGECKIFQFIKEIDNDKR